MNGDQYMPWVARVNTEGRWANAIVSWYVRYVRRHLHRDIMWRDTASGNMSASRAALGSLCRRSSDFQGEQV